MTLEFREAQIADLPQIVAIYNQIIPSRLATADLTPVKVAQRTNWFNEFNHEQRPLWLLQEDDQIVGWVGLESFYGRPAYAHTAEISLYLDQDWQHQGLGQQALDYVISQLPRLEVDTLLAYVFSHNLPSQHLFKRNQFATWAHLPDIALMDGQRYSLDILGRHFQNDFSS